MRAIAWILLGLVLGSFATLSAMNALRTANAVPKSVMTMMSYHMKSARDRMTAGQCDAGTRHHLQSIALLSRDITPAFLPIGERDELFAQYADQLRDKADVAAATPAAQCADLTEVVGQVGDACKACHRDFK